MKVRNGFVSNSSSSSFILSYDKTKVLTDPKDILEYIKKYDGTVIFNGGDYCEGDDIFELDEEQKSLIRKFPEEFIRKNTGKTTRTKYDYDSSDTENHIHEYEVEVPKLIAYVDSVALDQDPYEYKSPEVDMSDIPEVELPDDYMNRMNEPEIAALIKKSNEWYGIRDKRESEARDNFRYEEAQKAKQWLIDKCGVKPENAKAEYVDVSNHSCNNDWCSLEEFAERYLTDEYRDYDYKDYHLKRTKKNVAKPFAIFYKETLTDKDEIIDFISNSYQVMAPNAYIAWVNPVYDSIYDSEVPNYDFYQIGTPELDVLIQYKDKFKEDNRECVLYTETEIITDDVSNPAEINGKTLSLGFGKVIVIPTGNDVKDFKKNVKG